MSARPADSAHPANPIGDADTWLVYLLRCRDGSLYTGITNNLQRRLKAHTTPRGARYVRSRLPFVLVYREVAGSRSTALKREAQIKRMTRQNKLLLVARPAI